MDKYYWLNEDSRLFLKRDYLPEGVTAEKRIREIAENAEKILGVKGFADKFEDYVARGYYSLATPIWMNFGTKRGLPVSCFGSFIDDSVEGITTKVAEVSTMTKNGGGTSAYFGALRPRGSTINSSGGKSDGPVFFMEWFDCTARVISQSSARRGAFAAYLPVEHPDIKEFLMLHSTGHPIQKMNFGVTITDKWMMEMLNGDKDKRSIWLKILEKRYETGYPYIFYTDNVNNNAPSYYKNNFYKIHASNLCTEIMLPTSPDESFVCVLSSINLLLWDEIKNTDAVETLIYFLDAVNEEFVRKTDGKRYMEAANRFARNHRALGLGVLGWHSLLQSKTIPFESMEAKLLNTSIFRTIRGRADKATVELGSLLGVPELLTGTGRRNSTTMAIAPTTSSSFILGQVSQGIEPVESVYYTKTLEKGTFSFRNPYFKAILQKYDKDNEDVWLSVLKRGGSVQHLDFLSEREKGTFKTFGELSQKEIVIQAAARQKYIDQGQSLNLMIPLETSPQDVSELLIFGWESGIKTFYYQHGANPSQNLSRKILNCTSCEA